MLGICCGPACPSSRPWMSAEFGSRGCDVDREACCQSVVHRPNRHSGSIHGNPGHVDCKCCAPFHRWRPRPKLRRSYLDHHDISCRERGHFTDVCLAEPRLREKEILSCVCRTVYVDFIFLWIGAHSWEHAIDARASRNSCLSPCPRATTAPS